MNLFTYVVARDFGFAPNPFYGFCTLATCKPAIRSGAELGDWVVGVGAKRKYNLTGHLIYAMKVAETLTFDDYWSDPRFLRKRPVLNGSLKQVHGDNIYHHRGAEWIQVDSHHSLADGSANRQNVKKDTRTDRVLVATKFVYFGGAAIAIPERFRHFGPDDEDLCWTGQMHGRRSHEMAIAFEAWLHDRATWGVLAMPLE